MVKRRWYESWQYTFLDADALTKKEKKKERKGSTYRLGPFIEQLSNGIAGDVLSRSPRDTQQWSFGPSRAPNLDQTNFPRPESRDIGEGVVTPIDELGSGMRSRNDGDITSKACFNLLIKVIPEQFLKSPHIAEPVPSRWIHVGESSNGI